VILATVLILPSATRFPEAIALVESTLLSSREQFHETVKPPAQ